MMEVLEKVARQEKVRISALPFVKLVMITRDLLCSYGSAIKQGIVLLIESHNVNRVIQRVLGYLLLVILVSVVGVPTLWMISAAFKELPEIYRFPPTWIPLRPTFHNFPAAWNAAPFGRFFLNSFITTAFGSGFEIYFAITSAYALAFLNFPKKNWVFLLLLVALMIPAQVTILPNYILIGRMGWVNTYQGIILPGAAIA